MSNKVLRWMFYCVITWVLPVNAQAPSNIFEICEYSNQQCIDEVDAEINKASPRSTRWYELTLLKLDSLFSLQFQKPLLKETSEFVKDHQAPAFFRARIYIYHAKMLFQQGNKIQSEHYIDKASKLLASLHHSAPNPMTVILLVNVQNYTGGNQEKGYETLLQLEAQYKDSHNELMKYDLYNNLGHGAHYMGRLAESQQHREKALIAIQKTRNKAKLAEAHYNLARVMAYRELWAEAEPHLIHAEAFYNTIGDQLLIALSRLHLAESLYRQGKSTEAAAMFATVNVKKIPHYTQNHLDRISALFSSSDLK